MSAEHFRQVTDASPSFRALLLSFCLQKPSKPQRATQAMLSNLACAAGFCACVTYQALIICKSLRSLWLK
jgi:hypothetical protein